MPHIELPSYLYILGSNKMNISNCDTVDQKCRKIQRKVIFNMKHLLSKKISLKFNKSPKFTKIEDPPIENRVENIYVKFSGKPLKSFSSSKRDKMQRSQSCNILNDSKGLESRINKDCSLMTTKRSNLSIRFKPDNSQCPSCYFGDPVLTCTCSFRHPQTPDFKLYEDEDKFCNNFLQCPSHR